MGFFGFSQLGNRSGTCQIASGQGKKKRIPNNGRKIKIRDARAGARFFLSSKNGSLILVKAVKKRGGRNRRRKIIREKTSKRPLPQKLQGRETYL